MRAAIRVWVAPLVLAGLLACDDGPPPGPVVLAPPAWTPERAAAAEALATQLAALSADGGVAIRLAFGPEADLDLYVTGPLEETVYYANTPSRIGGELVQDRRCEHAGTRIEEVRFPVIPGRYRVGVDYARGCGETRAPAPFALQVDAPTGRESRLGIAIHQVFEPIVFEFEIEQRASSEDSR